MIEKFNDNCEIDVHVVKIAPVPSEIKVGRSNKVTVFLYAGLLTNHSSEHIVHIPSGTYVRWDFSSSFDVYYMDAKAAPPCVNEKYGNGNKK